MRAPLVIILLTALVLPPLASAEVQTFAATHTYALGDDDSRNSARQKCLAEAKRKILEQVGVYLESKTELLTSSQSMTSGSPKAPETTSDERQQITEQINTLAAGVMRTEVIKEEFGEVNERLQMTLTLKAEVDPDDIQKQLAARRVDKTVRDTVAAQQERLKRLEAQLQAMMQRQQGEQSSGHAFASPPSDIPAEAVQTWRTQAAQGNAEAQTKLGFLYDDGLGVPQDYAMARQWYEKAAAQGNATAQIFLGMLYGAGKGVPQDYAQAAKWLEKAAWQGNPDGQVGLGLLYYEGGRGVPQDYAQAAGWLEKAAAQGDKRAQYNLGFMYERGKGLPQDSAKARQWFEQAAAQGDASAQFSLGLMYDKGQGVLQNYVKARQWWERAAAQGHAKAHINLGFLYGLGHGVPQDSVRSYMWFKLAADDSTGKVQEYSADLRNKASQMMTPAEIAEAQRLSQQCQAQRFNGC